MAKNIKNAAQKIDLFFMLLLFFSYVFVYVVRFLGGESDLEFIIMLNIMFLLIVVSYYSNVIASIICCFLFVIGYGSYILYEAVVARVTASTSSYLWIAIIPISCIIVAFFRTYLGEVQEKIAEQSQIEDTLVGFDESTNMLNERMFQYELGRYMSMAARGYIKVTLMFVKVNYFDDIRRLVGKNGLNDLFKAVGESISELTRAEDAGYIVDEKGLFSVILISDAAGAAIVKDRLKSKMKSIDLQERMKTFNLSLDLKIGIAEYNPGIRTSIDFRQMALKDMEFDV